MAYHVTFSPTYGAVVDWTLISFALFPIDPSFVLFGIYFVANWTLAMDVQGLEMDNKIDIEQGAIGREIQKRKR